MSRTLVCDKPLSDTVTVATDPVMPETVTARDAVNVPEVGNVTAVLLVKVTMVSLRLRGCPACEMVEWIRERGSIRVTAFTSDPAEVCHHGNSDSVFDQPCRYLAIRGGVGARGSEISAILEDVDNSGALVGDDLVSDERAQAHRADAGVASEVDDNPRSGRDRAGRRIGDRPFANLVAVEAAANPLPVREIDEGSRLKGNEGDKGEAIGKAICLTGIPAGWPPLRLPTSAMSPAVNVVAIFIPR